MSHEPLRTAVLISGRGSNLKAIIDAIAAKRLDMCIVMVISSRADAAGIAFAQAAGVPVTVISQKSYADRASHDAAVNAAIEAARAQLIVLAGYMR
ncbi:MAG: formyltransferase family protein, partial [Lysobacterales bacterium]